MYMQLERTNLGVQTPGGGGASQACEALSLVLLADSRFQALTLLSTSQKATMILGWGR